MATDKRFVVKNGLQTENINFVYNDAVVGSSNITATMLSSNVLSFSGTSGQLFSIADTMTGVIFAVNDISGVPSIEVYDDGRVRMAEGFGNVIIGNSAINTSRTSTSTTTGILQVAGGAGIEGNINVGGTVNTINGSLGIGTTSPTAKLHVLNPIFSTANNGVFELDGTNDWINLGGSVFNFSAPWTMCGWLLKNADGSFASLMGNSGTSATGSGAFLGLAGPGGQANKPWLIVYNSSGSQTQLYGSTITVPNTWYNLVATHDGTTCKIYCNGNYENQASVSGFSISPDSFTIGAQRNTFWPLNGKIGPIKIYNRALSDIEIAQNFNALRGRYGV